MSRTETSSCIFFSFQNLWNVYLIECFIDKAKDKIISLLEESLEVLFKKVRHTKKYIVCILVLLIEIKSS